MNTCSGSPGGIRCDDQHPLARRCSAFSRLSPAGGTLSCLDYLDLAGCPPLLAVSADFCPPTWRIPRMPFGGNADRMYSLSRAFSTKATLHYRIRCRFITCTIVDESDETVLRAVYI